MKIETQKFQRYLNNTLTPEEATAFHQQLSQNEVLNQQFNLYKKAHLKTMKLFHADLIDRRQQIKQDLKSFRQREVPQTPTISSDSKLPKISKIRFYQYLSAASILLLLFAGHFILSQPTYDISVALIATEKHMYAVNLNGLEEIARSHITTANRQKLRAIQEKDLQEILRLYPSTVNLEEDNLLSLIKGIAYYQKKELEKAKTQLIAIIQEGKGQVDIAQWALASVYLKQGEIAEACQVLTKIKTPTDIKAKKIIELLPRH